MITFFVIGILFFALKMTGIAVHAAWGILKAVFFVLGIPVILIGMLVSGIVTLAIPLLIIAILATFLWPLIKTV